MPSTRRRPGGRSRARLAGTLSTAIAVAAAGAVAPPDAAAVTPSPWRGFTNVSGTGENPTFPPELVVAENGSALAAWVDGTEADSVVRVAERGFRGPWSSPLRLAGPALAGEPGASVNDAGDAAVAWAGGPGRDVMVAVRPGNTGAWREPANVSGAEPATGVDVHVAPGGDVVAAWRGMTTGIVRAAVRAADTGEWSLPEDISAPGRSGPVELTGSDDGTVMAAWGGGAGPKQTAVRGPSGGWGEPETLAAGGAVSSVQVAMGPGGDAAALQLGGAGGDPFVRAYFRPAGGTWGGPEDVSSPGATGVSSGHVEVDGDGRALAVWLRREGPRGEVRVAARATGGGWTATETVSPEGADATSPALAAARNGAATVVWRQPVEGDPAVRAAHRPPGGDWGDPENVAAPDGQIDPTLAAGAGARGATALWERGGILQSADRRTGRAGEVRLTRRQLLVNQRISQAAVRRMNAVRSAIADGLERERIRPGALPREAFGAGVEVDGEETGAIVPPGARAQLDVAGPGDRDPETVRLTADQLLVNQRISQAAVRRANAVARALSRGLGGGDVADGAVDSGRVAPGLSVRSTDPDAGQPEPSDLTPAPRRGDGSRVTLTDSQLLTNQRISQAAVLRANALRAELERGLPGERFRAGGVTGADLAPELR